MKKALKKLSILLSVVVLGTILAYSGIYARNGLQAQPGDKMTSAKWNELVSKVSGVFTDSNGNVGIGTSTPDSKLTIADGTPKIGIVPNHSGKSYIQAYDGIGVFRPLNIGATKIELDVSDSVVFPNGNVGIGTTTPSAKLDVEGTIKTKVINIGLNPNSLISLNNEPLTIQSTSKNAIRIVPPGDYYNATDNKNGMYMGGRFNNIGVNTTYDNHGNHNFYSNEYNNISMHAGKFVFSNATDAVAGSTYAPLKNTLIINPANSVGAILEVKGIALATAWNTTSDIRKKENITKLENPLEKISQLRGVNFDWKDSKKHDVGVIAQEVEKVFPEFVTTDKEGFKSVDYGKLTAPMIEAIKELKAENEKKDKQIFDLVKRLESLEQK